MDEEKTTESKESEDSKEDLRTRNKQERLDLIKSEDALLERMEEANKEKADNLTREEALADRKMLGGDSAGKGEETAPKEETAKEYKDKVMKGEL